MFTLKVFIPVVLLVGILFLNFQARANFLDPNEAKKLVKDGALLVDVRTSKEYKIGHITGAINIPLSQVQSRLQDFGTKDSKIVVYCRSGNRSGKAQSILLSEGFKHVYNLGGIGRWSN